jgi:CelD/BcsL family acetyltransferase involved in cellulose biosynthesis
MNIGCIRDYESLGKLEPEWNALLQESQSNNVFLTWEWISTWWEIFGADFEMRVLIDRDASGKLRGIAPLMIGRDQGSFGRNFRCLMIIGQRGDTLAEYLDFLIRRGCEKEVTTAFVEFITHELAADWDYIFFERILTSSPNFSLLKFSFEQQKLLIETDGKMPSPFLRLPASWEDLFKAQSKNFRRQWNNSWNRLTRDAEIKLHFAGKDLSIEQAFQELARLHHLRWENESASFRTQKYLRFHHELSCKLHQNGWLLFMLISANGEYIAARYDFVYANKIWCFQGGWNPAYDSQRVGTVLTGKIIEWGIQNGLQEYDFLGGEADYKKRWADGERLMMNFTTWNRKKMRGRFCELIFKCKKVKRWAKKLFGP